MTRTMKRSILAVGAALLLSSGLFAQDQDDIKQSIEAKRFVFTAQSASPMGGGTRQLTSGWDLTMAGDSLISYLPYFGRAFGPVNPGQGGLNFTSTGFEYSSTPGRKGGWDIIIRPTDNRDVRQFNLSVSESGYGTLQVLSNNRQPISFYGSLSPTK